MSKLFIQGGLCLCLLFFTKTIIAQVKPVNDKPLPIDTALYTGRLTNGFTYYIRRNAEPRHAVTIYLVNKVGSILEDEDQRGLAHFMEHMNFNGSVHFPHNQLVDYLQRIGVRFGADVNAYTSYDETVYQLPVSLNKPGVLDSALLIMHDWANGALLDSMEIEKERGVVLEEKRLGKGANERMQRKYMPMFLNGSRYAERMPIGPDTVLNNFKRTTISRFYHDWYRPDLQALIVVGDIDADSLQKVIKTQFADLQNPLQEKTRPVYTIGLDGKNHFMTVTDKETTAQGMLIIIKKPRLGLKSTSDYVSKVKINMFNMLLQNRCLERIRSSQSPFIFGGAGIYPFEANLDNFNIHFIAKPNKLKEALQAIWKECLRVKLYGFTSTEIERAKAEILSDVQQRYNERDKTTSIGFVKQYQNEFLNGMSAMSVEDEYHLEQQLVPNISRKSVNELSQKYFVSTNRDILVWGADEDKSILPDSTVVIQWLHDVENKKLQPYLDRFSKLPLLSSFPNHGNIVSMKYDNITDITKFILSNGMRVFVKTTDFQNDEIKFYSFSPGGTSLANDQDYYSAKWAAQLIPLAGIGNYNYDEFIKYTYGKSFFVSPVIDERFTKLDGMSNLNDLKNAFEVIDAYFTKPRMNKQIWQSKIENQISALRNTGDDPDAVFTDTIASVLGNYSIRRKPETINSLQKINFVKLYRFYKKSFADAANFTFIFVGNITATQLRPYLEKYLAALPATHSSVTARDLGIHIPAGQIRRTVYKGAEPKAHVTTVYSGAFDYNFKNVLLLNALKECLQIRLIQRLREDESEVYTPSVAMSYSKYPQARFKITIDFGCAPGNADKLTLSVSDEIKKLVNTGPTRENLGKWKAEDKTSMDIAVKTNSFWIDFISGELQNNEPLKLIADYSKVRDEITPEDVQHIASLCLSGKNLAIFKLLPEQSSTKTEKK